VTSVCWSMAQAGPQRCGHCCIREPIGPWARCLPRGGLHTSHMPHRLSVCGHCARLCAVLWRGPQSGRERSDPCKVKCQRLREIGSVAWNRGSGVVTAVTGCVPGLLSTAVLPKRPYSCRRLIEASGQFSLLTGARQVLRLGSTTSHQQLYLEEICPKYPELCVCCLILQP